MKKLCIMWLASVAFAAIPAPALASSEASETASPPLQPEEVTEAELASIASVPALGQEYDVPSRTPELESEPEETSPLSGGLDLKSRYVFDDLYVATPGPALQGWLSLALGDSGCSLGTFGSLDLDRDRASGDEIDISAKCRIDLAEETAVTVEAARYILFDPGTPELNVVSATLEHRGFSVEASYIHWEGGFEDGWSLDASYTRSVSGFDLEAGVLYESGLTLPDIVVARFSASHRIAGPISANVTGYVPLHRGAGETRTAQVVFGLSYSF